MVKAMKNIVRRVLSAMAAVALLSAIGAPAFAQTTAHQRVGVEAKDSLEATVGTTLEVFRSDTAKTNGVEIDPTISLDLFFRRRFGLSFEVPALVWIATGREAVPRAVGAVGDPEVTASYTFRLSDWRLSAALSYTHPLGIWNYYEARERQIASGSGYPKLGALFSAVRYLDPIVAGTSLRGETCFARPERSGTSTRPLILTANLFATEALNDVVALSASLSPKLSWPRYLNGVPDESGIIYSLTRSASLVFSEKDHTLRVGVSKLLSDYSSPVAFDRGFPIHSEKE
jgi:hypothetical protein